MSVVIIGGNERMEQQYKTICNQYGHKAKVFTKMCGNLRGQIGKPDLMILFTNTVSHKLVNCALLEAERSRSKIARSHSSSSCALKNILESHG